MSTEQDEDRSGLGGALDLLMNSLDASNAGSKQATTDRAPAAAAAPRDAVLSSLYNCRAVHIYWHAYGIFRKRVEVMLLLLLAACAVAFAPSSGVRASPSLSKRRNVLVVVYDDLSARHNVRADCVESSVS